ALELGVIVGPAAGRRGDEEGPPQLLVDAGQGLAVHQARAEALAAGDADAGQEVEVAAVAREPAAGAADRADALGRERAPARRAAEFRREGHAWAVRHVRRDML